MSVTCARGYSAVQVASTCMRGDIRSAFLNDHTKAARLCAWATQRERFGGQTTACYDAGQSRFNTIARPLLPTKGLRGAPYGVVLNDCFLLL